MTRQSAVESAGHRRAAFVVFAICPLSSHKCSCHRFTARRIINTTVTCSHIRHSSWNDSQTLFFFQTNEVLVHALLRKFGVLPEPNAISVFETKLDMIKDLTMLVDNFP